MTSDVDVVIIGTTALNGGDAALLAGELATLRLAFPSLAVTIFDQHPEPTARLFPDLHVRPTLTWPRGNHRHTVIRNAAWLMRLARLSVAAFALKHGRRVLARLAAPRAEDLQDLERYRAADLVMTPAGTMLVDQHTFIPRLVDWWLVLTLGRPLVVFTQTLGEFRRPTDRILARAVFRRAALVLVRGDESYERALRRGAPPDRVHVVADPAFLLATAPPRIGSPRRRVAISVRDWPFFSTSDARRNYEAAIRAVCTHLVQDHLDVEFVSTCQGVPEYWTDDSDIATQIVEALPAEVRSRVTVDRAHRSPAALRDYYGEFDVLIATRLHAAILALDAGTPVVAIAYEPKTTEVFARLDAQEVATGIEDLDGAWLCATVDRVLAERDVYAARFRAAVMRERDDAAAVAELVRAVVADAHRATP